MLTPSRIKNKDLKRLVVRGDERGIRPDWLAKTKRILAALNVATSPADLDLPSFGWHQLKGNREGTYSVWVSRNHRITFRWDDEGPYDVKLEDYHGS